MFVPRVAAPALAAAVILSACGGHGGGAAVSPSATGSTTTAGAARGTLALTIKIPHPSGSSSTTRHAAYISSSTQSLALRITQGSTTVLQEGVALTPSTNPNCTAGATTTCTITIGLAAGSYTGIIATYDGPLVNGTATGNMLSQGQSIPLTVTSGNTNTIAATLDGIPASITIAPASGSTITGTQSGGFNVPYTPQPLSISALDADGNIILGAGAPTFTVSATTSKFTVTQPTSNAPNTFTLESAAGGTGTLSLTAAPPDAGFSCTASGVVCTATASLTSTPHSLYVMYSSGIGVYQSMDNITWNEIGSQGYSPGGYYPTWIAADTNGNVFAADSPDQYFDIFTPPYSASPTQLTGLQEPNGIAATSSDQLLIADSQNLKVFAPPFTGTPALESIPGSSAATGLVIDTSNNAFVLTGTSVVEFASPYSGTPTTVATPPVGSSFLGIAIGPDNTLFVGINAGFNNQGQILVSAPPYTSTPITFTLPLEMGEDIAPQALTVDANGNLWVYGGYYGGSCCNAYLFEFAKPFSGSSAPTITQSLSTSPYEMAADSSGDLIVSTSSSTISIINESGSTVGTITSGVSNTQNLFYVK